MKSSLKDISFDLRQRYRMSSELIETVRRIKPLRILDVGSGEGCLDRFLPEDRIFSLDIQISPGDRFVAGDLAFLPFASGTFDLVVSLDVLEHIEPGQRKVMLNEMARVSREHLIVGAPFQGGKITQAEKLANDFFRQAIGRENEFLSEHQRFGLPKLKEINAWIDGRGYYSVSLPSNYLPLWLVMMGLSAYFATLPLSGDLMESVTELCDRYLTPYDRHSPGYRKIFLIAKSGNLDAKAIRKQFTPPPLSTDFQEKTWELAEKILSRLTRYHERIPFSLKAENDRVQKDNQRLTSEIAELIKNFRKLEDNHRQLEVNYRKLEPAYINLEKDYRRLEERYRELEDDYRHNYNLLDKNYRKLEDNYRKLEPAYINLEKDYRRLEDNHRQLETELQTIKSTWAYRLYQKTWGRIRKRPR